MYFIFTAQLNLDISSMKMLHLYFHFIEYAGAKVDSHTQVVSNTQCFPTTESNIKV